MTLHDAMAMASGLVLGLAVTVLHPDMNHQRRALGTVLLIVGVALSAVGLS
jgi:zinc transporter ZupT